MATVTEEGLPQEITNHPAYPGQKLRRVTDNRTFTCDGCMRPASAGTRYRIVERDGKSLDHHICCALGVATQRKLTHPKFGDLAFLPAPPEGTDGKGRFCGGACGKPVNGFVYHCSGSGVSFHPCCVLQSCKCTVAVAKKPGPRPMSRYRNPAW